MRTVPPYPGKTASDDQMLRDLYRRVEQVESVLRIQEDPDTVTPGTVILSPVSPLRFKFLEVPYTRGYDNETGRADPLSFDLGGQYVLFSIRAHVFHVFSPYTPPVSDMELFIGTDIGSPDRFSVALGVFPVGFDVYEWSQIALLYNPITPPHDVLDARIRTERLLVGFDVTGAQAPAGSRASAFVGITYALNTPASRSVKVADLQGEIFGTVQGL